MTITVSVEDAGDSLSKLVEAVQKGENVLLTERNVPVAVVRALPLEQQRRFGALKGLFSVPEEFFDPLPDDEVAPWE